MVVEIALTYDIENAISLLEDITHDELRMMGKFCHEKVAHDFNFENFRFRLCSIFNSQ